MKSRIAILTVSSAVLIASNFFAYSAEPRNVLLNGSFESPVGPTNWIEQTTPSSWVSEGRVHIANGKVNESIPWAGLPYPLAQDGTQYLVLTGGDILSQSFIVTNSESYLLSWFDCEVVVPGAATTGALYSVSITTDALQLVTRTNFDAFHRGWKTRSVRFYLTNGTYSVRFGGYVAPYNNPPLIDNVILLEQPEDLIADVRTYGVEIRWNGRTNQMYQVQYRNVTDGTWANLGEPTLGTETNALADPISNNERRFYRVIRVP